MAYGRLDVFWPDGLFKTYLLEADNISVGRAATSAIALDSDTISRYHLSITRRGDEVFITDLESSSGTFVDGMRLQQNTPHRLLGGEEILIGELLLIYHDVDESPTRPVPVPEEVTRRIELKDGRFAIDIEGPEIAISPGAHTSARVKISNLSDQPERFSIAVEGIPREWLRIDRPEIDIAAGRSGEAVISIKPVRRSDSKPGIYTLRVTVQLKSDPDAAATTSVPVTILPFSSLGADLETPRLYRGQAFRLGLHNRGSAPLSLQIMGHDPEGSGLRFAIVPPQVAVAPGQRIAIAGRVQPRRQSVFGDARLYPFDVRIRSSDASGFLIGLRGQLVEQPPLPRWTAYVLLGLSLMTTAIIFFGLLLLLRPAPPPAIDSFNAGSTRVAQGTPIELTWSLRDANDLRLLVDGREIAVLDPTTTSAQLNTGNYTGTIDVRLLASNGSGQAEASTRIEIYQPLAIEYFTINPQPLMRYVVQPVTISWSASSAAITQLNGIEALSTTPIDPVYGPAATIMVLGHVRDEPVTLELFAQSADGASIRQAQTIETIDPLCLTLSEVRLHDGPSTANQVISTVQANTTLVATARDLGGGWLRLRLPAGTFGWGEREAFLCAPEFNPDDLIIDASAPTPPPSPTPSATAPPTTTPLITTTPAPATLPPPTATAPLARPTATPFGAG